MNISCHQPLIAVALWWTAHIIATIASKSVMIMEDDSPVDLSSFQDLRWVDLTAIQLLCGSVAAVTWTKMIMGKAIWTKFNTNDQKMCMCLAAFWNIFGSLASNIAYSYAASSTVQVIRGCEPIIMFVLTLLFHRDHSSDHEDLFGILSIVITSLGAVSFIFRDTTLIIWGLVAALISNTAFTIRDIYLNKLSNVWKNPSQKLVFLSIYSMLFLLPVILIKQLMISEVSIANRVLETIASGVFTGIYSVTSTLVLEMFNPLTFSFLTVSKEAVVIVANILYFLTPISSSAVLGLLLFIGGSYLHQFNITSKKKHVLFKSFSLFTMYLLMSSTHSQKLFQPLIAGAVNKNQLGLTELSTAVEKCPWEKKVFTVWIYKEDIPDVVITNIKYLAWSNPATPIHVYCGTAQCYQAIAKLSIKNLGAEITDFTKSVLFGGWLAHFPFHEDDKELEALLQEVGRVDLLWTRGGIFVDPSIRITDPLPLPRSCEHPWIMKGVKEREGLGLLDISYFPRTHPFILKLADFFMNKYPIEAINNASLLLEFKKSISVLFASCIHHCPDRVGGIQFERVNLLKTRSFVSTTLDPLYDDAQVKRIDLMKFDPLPTLSLGSRHVGKRLSFFLIFTTSNKSIVNRYSNNITLRGAFNWRHMRTVESIFYHHPTSHVTIYSNTLTRDTFEDLSTAGYSIRVQGYDLRKLIAGTPAHDFVYELELAREGPHWYAHEADLIRLILLYRYGGVYMDTDVILVKPLDPLTVNTLGWQDDHNHLLNTAFLFFEKGNMFLKSCLEEFVRGYDSYSWAGNGPFLVTRVWQESYTSSNAVHVLPYYTFYVFHYSELKQYCFNIITSGVVFRMKMKLLNEKAYGVHLNGKITGSIGIGKDKLNKRTICSQLLNSFCILCHGEV